VSAATLSTLGTIGFWLSVVGGLAIVVELTLAAVWGAALGKRVRTLAEGLDRERGALQDDIQRVRLALEETRRLWQPYRRTLRWLRHPLVVALLQSYRRRVVVR